MSQLHGWRLVALTVAIIVVGLILWAWIGLNHGSHPIGPTTPQG